ncbi:electron transport complex subunit RsxD [Ectothiorhodospiraceae bacterium 2226]|nr:electron transport complex subunit RsxD [Ectothiorhodospiraceae bacterium 2226]
MLLNNPSSPHVRGPLSVNVVMLRVLYTLVPGVAAYVWFFGWGVVINISIAVVAALASEALMLRLRGRPLMPHLTDGSAIVTGVLLALALPPLLPWWMTAVGAAFGIIVAKQLYGGLGYNVFNPAMVGYAMLLISFPREMTQWLPPETIAATFPDFWDSLRYAFTGVPPAPIDAITMATPLDHIKTELGLNRTITEIKAGNPLIGEVGGVGWEVVNLAFLAGGVWLMLRRVISWHIPVAMLGTLGALATVFYLTNPDANASPLFHLFSGAAILGAFFIATDPVSAATTPRGRLIFGAGVGALTFVIRVFGGYPDGVAFAVLLMNMAAPTIDYYTQPRAFGHGRR